MPTRTPPAQCRRMKSKPISANRQVQTRRNVARLGEAPCAHRHGNAAGPGPAAVDPEGTRHAALGHRRLQRRRAKRRHLARGGRRIGPGSEDPDLYRRAGFGQAADERRVCDLAVPARAYPGDHYTVTGYLQAQAWRARWSRCKCFRGPPDAPAAEEGTGEVLETQQVTLGGDGEVLPVKFELTPDELGRRTFCFRVQDAGRRPKPGRQLPRGRHRNRRPQESRPAVGRRADARLPVPPQPALSRSLDHGRRAAADRPGRDVAGGKNPRRLPFHPRRNVRLRLRRGLRSRLAGAERRAGRTAGKMGRRAGRRPDRRRRAGLRRQRR